MFQCMQPNGVVELTIVHIIASAVLVCRMRVVLGGWIFCGSSWTGKVHSREFPVRLRSSKRGLGYLNMFFTLSNQHSVRKAVLKHSVSTLNFPHRDCQQSPGSPQPGETGTLGFLKMACHSSSRCYGCKCCFSNVDSGQDLRPFL